MPVFAWGLMSVWADLGNMGGGRMEGLPFLRRESEVLTPPDVRLAGADEEVVMVVDMAAMWKEVCRLEKETGTGSNAATHE